MKRFFKALPIWAVIACFSLIFFPWAVKDRLKRNIWGGGPGLDIQNAVLFYGTIWYVGIVAAIVYAINNP